MREDFHSLDEIMNCCRQVLTASPADETELVWYERRRGDAEHLEAPRLTVLVRTIERGRLGWYRTDTPDAHLLESGVRQALALSQLQNPLKKRPVLPTSTKKLTPTEGVRLFDPAIAALTPEAARELLAEVCRDDERADLSWSESHLVVVNSHGLQRKATTTEISLAVEIAQDGEVGPGAGFAAASSRTIDGLQAEATVERARIVHAENANTPSDDVPSETVPVLLSPEAAVELLNVINAHAFSGRAFLDGTSFLSRHRNVQVFDRTVHLRDDGTAGHGMPFPFDLEGTPKRPLDLIVEGTPSTPALNQAQSASAGLEPTGQAVGGQDALFGNLFLLPGNTSRDRLMEAADGGLRIGRLESLECFEPQQLHVRALARGVRKIENGKLGAPLPDLIWEESLLRVLALLGGIGRTPVARAAPTTPLGSISSPALVLSRAEGFRIAR